MAAPVATTYRPSTTQSKAYTGTSAAVTNAFGSQTYRVRLWATTDCHVVFAGSPTATTSDMPLTARVPEYFSVNPGEKVAAIQDSAGGTLYVTELTQ